MTLWSAVLDGWAHRCAALRTLSRSGCDGGGSSVLTDSGSSGSRWLPLLNAGNSGLPTGSGSRVQWYALGVPEQLSDWASSVAMTWMMRPMRRRNISLKRLGCVLMLIAK